MVPQSFSDKQLNYFKFASIVLNEFPKALRQTFKSMWDNTTGHRLGFQPWDDSIAVRKMFLGLEGGTTKCKVNTDLSYEKWDCTALFQATVYARSFSLCDSKDHYKTLSDLYVKPHKLAHGSFHATVLSPGRNEAETFALAIDQLRLLRNTLCHLASSEIDKPKLDRYMQLSKDAFQALQVKTDPIDYVSDLAESSFPTEEFRKLQQDMKDETLAYIKFLEGVITDKSSEIHELKMLLEEIKGKVERNASKNEIAKMLELKINELKSALGLDKPGKYSLAMQLGNRLNLNSRLLVMVNSHSSLGARPCSIK